MRPFGYAFFLTLVISHCRENPIKLDGDFSTPQKAAELHPDKAVTGKISADAPIYFRLKLAEPMMLRAEIGAIRGIDSSLALLTADQGDIVTVDDNGSSLPEEIFPVHLGPGEFFLRISGKGIEQGSFTFFYRLFKPPANVEIEPNNDTATASKLMGDHAAGFYGPEYAMHNGAKVYEQDCYSRELAGENKGALSLQLSGVDGIRGHVLVLDSAGKKLLEAEATEPGGAVKAGPVGVPASGKIFICVAAQKIPEKASKDYYELKINVSEVSQLNELEPNDSEKNASFITADRVDGTISGAADADYFRWKNRREYAVYVRAELSLANSNLLRMLVERNDGTKLRFEDSAPGKEVAENLRVEPGEDIIIAIRLREKAQVRKFLAQPYSIKLKDSVVTDEGENEQNDSADKADTLVDQTQKWGFINPPGDVDFYRVQVSEDALRTVTIESKLNCKLRLEHFRDTKSLASQVAIDALKYTAIFRKNDMVKLNCLGQKKYPAERAYRIAMTE